MLITYTVNLVLLKFDQVFGDMIFDVIFSFTESLCLPCSNFKNHKSFLSFILNLLKSKQSFADKFALSGNVKACILNCF